MRSVSVLGLAVAFAFAVNSSGAVAGDPGSGPLKLRHDGGTITWTDIKGETSYTVSGHVTYWPAATCIGAPSHIEGQTVNTDERLPANTITYVLQPPSDSRLTWQKEANIIVKATDDAGNVLATDGFGYTADAFCTDEEIAAELAAAGNGGPIDSTTDRALLTIALLGVAGIAALGVGALMKRRTL